VAASVRRYPDRFCDLVGCQIDLLHRPLSVTRDVSEFLIRGGDFFENGPA
jgi:hypothetical protein